MHATPFRSVPDRAWYFESPSHEEALSRLLFLVEERRACGLLVGAEGTGKSIVLSLAARNSRRDRRQVAEVDLAGLEGHELLWRMSARMGLGPKRGEGSARLWRTLEDYLAGAQLSLRQTVFAFDHADLSLPDCGPVLERLLRLAERMTGGLTILLATRNPPLPSWCDGVLRFCDLRIELQALDARQTSRYVAASLRQAGCERELFNPPAIAAVFEESRGVPRTVNRLCELSLLAAMGANQKRIEPGVVRSVAHELAPV